MRACTHRGWAHLQRVSTTFLTRINSHKVFLCSCRRRDSNLRSLDLEFFTLPTELPRPPIDARKGYTSSGLSIYLLLCNRQEPKSQLKPLWFNHPLMTIVGPDRTPKRAKVNHPMVYPYMPVAIGSTWGTQETAIHTLLELSPPTPYVHRINTRNPTKS